jgi:hypothetical protein
VVEETIQTLRDPEVHRAPAGYNTSEEAATGQGGPVAAGGDG